VRTVLRVLNEPVAAPPRVVEVVKEKQPLTLVGGVDLSFFRDDKRTAIAALVVCSFPQLEVYTSSPPPTQAPHCAYRTASTHARI
jgi:hypothetical protein